VASLSTAAAANTITTIHFPFLRLFFLSSFSLPLYRSPLNLLFLKHHPFTWFSNTTGMMVHSGSVKAVTDDTAQSRMCFESRKRERLLSLTGATFLESFSAVASGNVTPCP
jgi:hypothetical protein